MIIQELLNTLKKYGFKWYKDACTDTVDSKAIMDVIPAANGFTVLYVEGVALIASTAVVERIEMPQSLDDRWILVHWTHIEDEANCEFSCTKGN